MGFADLPRGGEGCVLSGWGHAVCGTEGVPGMLVDHHLLMYELVARGTRNPVNGKPIDMDWARRHLGSGSIAVGWLEPLVEHLGLAPPPGTRSASEWDLIAVAAEQALQRAGVGWDELDAVVHVSPTIAFAPGARGPVGFQDEMREFPRRYPLPPHCALYHLAIGCPGLVPALHLARPLVQSGHCGRVLVVTSVWGGALRDCPRAGDLNDISVWLSALLFGDAASAVVLSAPELLPDSVDRWLEIGPLWRWNDPHTWIARYNHLPGVGSFPSINPAAAKQLFVDRLLETAAHAGIRLADCDLVVMHQPNADLVQQVNASQFAGSGRSVRDIAVRYGNLVCSSAGVSLSQGLQAAPAMADGGRIFMFTLGADAGTTWGGALMRHRRRGQAIGL